ncbi:kinase-like domain-containing protein [Irpex rosettiformis]|uniref:Kinase-like domain-containing protein n=1 Tax=Irpex rosettiformis TaxID=378272 RepID=A0ACB8U3Y0_9APHY|nr:kinase-like domain-containing protein [Irpex rosettiformis]
MTLARCARYHWLQKYTTALTMNPAEDLAQQLRDFLLFLYNSPEVVKLHSNTGAIANNTWYREFPDIHMPPRLHTLLREVNVKTAQIALRSDIITEVFKTAAVLDMSREGYNQYRYIDLYSRGNFGPEVRDRQSSLFEFRFRAVVFFQRNWSVPPSVLSREIIVRILLCLIADETGLSDEMRPYTTSLASPTGKEAEKVQKVLYSEIMSCATAELRNHYRRVLTRLAQRAGTLPVVLRLTGVERLVSLSSGGFADVYTGKWGKRDVVIKSGRALKTTPNDPEIRAQLFLELITWATVKHPRILEFLGYTEIKDLSPLCMVSPFMQGKTAQERCDLFAEDRLNLPARKRLLREIAEGMVYLHSEGVIHGDLRGSNVFLTPDEHVKIADFGLCVYASGVTQNYYSLRTGNTRWVAPELIDSISTRNSELQQERRRLQEQIHGVEELVCTGRPTISSDIYSFACTCVELIDGRVPYYDQKSDTQVIHFVTTFWDGQPGRPPRPQAILRREDDALWELMQRCWVPLTNVTTRPGFDWISQKLIQIVSRPTPAHSRLSTTQTSYAPDTLILTEQFLHNASATVGRCRRT